MSTEFHRYDSFNSICGSRDWRQQYDTFGGFEMKLRTQKWKLKKHRRTLKFNFNNFFFAISCVLPENERTDSNGARNKINAATALQTQVCFACLLACWRIL
jgi:hypothetical protein